MICTDHQILFGGIKSGRMRRTGHVAPLETGGLGRLDGKNHLEDLGLDRIVGRKRGLGGEA